MAILWVKEKPGRRGSIDRENVREYTKRFLLKSTVPNESETAIRIHAAIPKPWQTHPDDPLAFVTSVSPQQQGNKYLWDVEVEYSSEIEEREQDKNPLARPAKISWASQDFTRIAVLDNEGNPLVNKAGDPPEGGGLEIEDSRWVISVEKNVAAVPKALLTYDNAVNDGSVRLQSLTFPSGTLKLKGLRISERKEENGVPFFTVSFQLHYRSEGWTRQVLNRGFREKIEKEITDEEGNPKTVEEWKEILVGTPAERITEPVFLDEDGKAFRNEEGKVRQPKPSEIVVLEFDVEKKKPFSALPLK